MRLRLDTHPELRKPYVREDESSAFKWNMVAIVRGHELRQRAYPGLTLALVEVGCYPDTLTLCDEAKRKGVSGIGLSESEKVAQECWAKKMSNRTLMTQGLPMLEKMEIKSNGVLLLRPYPWVNTALLEKSSATVFKRSGEIEKASNGKCKISSSTIGPAGGYGVIALEDIAEGETILQEQTVVAAVHDYNDGCIACCAPVPATKRGTCFACCKMRICSPDCAEQATRHFHKAVCGTDVPARWRSTCPGSSARLAARERLTQIVLATVVKAKQAPLEVALINQLIAPYSKTVSVPFNFGTDIVNTTALLQSLGVDIFANANYDTWVIHTINARVQNNMHYGVNGAMSLAVHPLYSFINHSCRRNAHWTLGETVSKLSIVATQPIKKGDEVFIQYQDVATISSSAARRNALKSWLPEGCLCPRCKGK